MDTRPGKLPIGIQDYSKLITGDYKYIDKSEHIYTLVHGYSQCFLSRPRRFGKSLLLSSIRAYWEGRKELFDGLKISGLEAASPDAWQVHPVLYFDFNIDNYNAPNALERVLDDHLKGWESLYGCANTGTSLAIRFKNVITGAFQATGQRCVILVDEYDRPLLNTNIDSGQAEHNRDLFKGFFSCLKSQDAYIQFVLITGVTKISIFSDLNQLQDISFSAAYSDICGITEEELSSGFPDEIRALADSNNISVNDCMIRLKETYDGYLFSRSGIPVYNPYSLLNAFSDRDFRYYWFETGTPTFLVKKLRDNNYDVRQFEEQNVYATERELTDYRADNPDLIPLLYQTGYLTIKGYDEEGRYYILGFPNDEVKFGFLESLLPQYVDESATASGKNILSLNRQLRTGNLDKVRDIFTALFAGLPKTTGKTKFEDYFQIVIYLIFTLLGQFVQCEVISSNGRADCIVETDSYIYLFEFKRDGTADEAIQQINDKGYALPYAADTRTLYRIGVSFDSSTGHLADWKVVEV